MKNHRISIRFSRLSDAGLNAFTSAIITGMTDNPAFPAPLVPLPQLAGLQQDFASAKVNARDGGRTATAAKNQARANLMSALRTQASYVQGVARHDFAALVSSGFKVASQNRVPAPLTRPAIAKILNERVQELVLRVTPVANARSYQLQMQGGAGGWQEAGFFTQARRIVVTNLTSGTNYKFRIRALGGSTGQGDWSDVVSRISL
jgi:hypothetical protein